MRFLIDHDVDVEVCRQLRKAGHQCERAANVIKSTDDDDISVYADDHDWIVLSHDVGLFNRRRERTFGRHVRLGCSAVDAVAVLSERLPELVDELKAGAGVYRVSKTGVRFFAPRWR